MTSLARVHYLVIYCEDMVGMNRPGQGLTEVLAKLFDEKITHPETRQLMMDKLPELQVCLTNMAAMTPEITMQNRRGSGKQRSSAESRGYLRLVAPTSASSATSSIARSASAVRLGLPVRTVLGMPLMKAIS
ncbi:hypothetical protein HPB48_026480 [Haemaphysalis longicornis]|uniref:Uncharacterized protein n=1 Tax=Haemaphysalis longicornis TaxID=44386 RepID=A0A9J6HC58_HAELO|nr:hypothetical protein HPB48_026480 [Haemaphysalis longicornis]